jgi:serine/threonine protein kinase
MQASATPKGTIVQGEYVLLEPIGEAGGSVYRAHHMPSGRLVAARLWLSDAPGAAERALETARIASRVRHPALAAVEAFGQMPDGTLFIVSEYVTGEPLDRWADKAGIPPLATVIDVVHRLCVGLNAAHRNGLTHDALHARNVRVTQGDSASASRLEVRLLDLGVPAFMHPWPPRMHAAQFMAPEQLARALRATGAGGLQTDGPMNVYACGCILYYLCAGGAPYQDRNLHDLTLSHAAGRLVLPSKINPQIPASLDEITARALAVDPAERYPSVSELALALARVQLTRTSSGVRPVVNVPVVIPSAPEPDKRSTWSKGFEERPTSESKVPLLLSLRERQSVPPADGSAPAPRAGALAAPSVERPVPAGSFSSSPPPADVDTLPPPPRSSAPPPRPSAAPPRVPPSAVVPRAPRLEPQPISALLDPVVLRRMELDSQPPGAVAPYSEPPMPAARAAPSPRRRRPPSLARISWIAALTVAVIVGFWLLGRHAPPPEQVRTTPLPSVQSAPRGTTARPVDVEARGADARGMPAPHPPNGLVPDAPAPSAEGARMERTNVATPHSVRAGRARPSGIKNSARAPVPPRLGTEASLPEPQLAIDPIDETSSTGSDEPDLDTPEAAASEDEAPTDGDAPGAEPGRVAAVHASPSGAAGRPVRAGSAVATARATASRTVGEVDREREDPRPLRASARIDDLTVRGSLTTSEVRRAVERIRPQLNACYTRVARAAGRNGYGAMNVEIEIDERGRAHAPRASGGALPGLDVCVAQAAGRIVSGRPPDTGTVKASWKVAFSP